MIKNKYIQFWLIACLTMLFNFSAFAKDITFEISVDKNTAQLNDAIELSLTFSETQSMPKPNLNDLEGFQIQYVGPSTSITVINGQASTYISHKYFLIPHKEGNFTIGPFAVVFEGKTYTSNSIPINITKATPSAQPQRQSAQSANEPTDLKERLFLKLDIPKKSAYTNEKIPLTLKLCFYRLQLRDIQYPLIPQEGFSAEPYAQPKQYQENINGLVYDVFEFKTNLLATHAGTFTIGPANLKCSVLVQRNRRRAESDSDNLFSQDFFDNFFGAYQARPVNAISETVNLTVNSLPEENKPADFKGSIGNFTLHVSAQPQNVKTGDPITLQFVIEGAGNLNSISCPPLTQIENFKIYDPSVKQENNQKIFEQVIMPLSETITEIPAVQFSFFNPETKNYETLRSQPIPITVTKSEQPQTRNITTIQQTTIEPLKEEQLGRDIFYIKETPGEIFIINNHLYKKKWFWLAYFFPLMLYFIAIFRQKWMQKFKTDTRFARGYLAPRKAKINLKNAKASLVNQKIIEFYDAMFKTMQEYFGDKYHLTSTALTFDILEKTIKDENIPTDITQKLKNIFTDFDKIRYSAVKPDKERAQQTFTDACEIIDFFEKHKK